MSDSHPVPTIPPFFHDMPVLITKVDEDLKQLFKQQTKNNGLSESELLRLIVIEAMGKAQFSESNKTDLTPDTEKSETERITVRMPSFLMQAAKEKGKAKGMATSRWIAALVQSNIAKNPVMADQELNNLKASIRELNAIGRNINQMARALNESRNNTDKVNLDTLYLLGDSLKRNLSAVRELVRASQQVWEAE
ncbi:MAG: plasmid mobilization relaxosome protein MobC [Candidatus Methylumidiphilus alinenensis]|uniref:Plasmid mobilization relaxosome protein MobC n=1 Tax=Candidatus Methylumidiphilus alinenensis TaxID=2202197 RepID=A0A2W4RNN0_9GAMM|nr:MAG: plasmid mobilization relaxosome protein MobC [Candidatus Methylumidiphilus alinenensis]